MSKQVSQKQIVAMGGGGWGMEPDNERKNGKVIETPLSPKYLGTS